MPVHTTKRDGKWYVADKGGKLTRNKKGTLVKKGGFRSKKKAVKQVQAINRSLGYWR